MNRPVRWRPADAFVHGVDGPVVLTPRRAAEWLADNTDLRQRIHDRDIDRDIYEVLTALVAIGTRRGAATSAADGSTDDAAHARLQSSGLVNSKQAANALGITDRGVRHLAAAGVLRATRPAGRWLFHPDDIDRHRRRTA